MLNLNNTSHILLIVLTCFLFTLCITFYVKKIARHIGAMDMPDARKVHTKPMPRLGGLGIFLGFLFGYMLFGVQSIQMNSILIGSFIIVLTGVIDDIKPLEAKTKLVGQILAACVIIFYGNILLNEITIFGIYVNFGIFTYPLTIIFVLACINIINLIDGLDGLSSGTCSIFYLTIGVIAFMSSNLNSYNFSIYNVRINFRLFIS